MTTHYQKIQALGNRMAENLTIMGVPSQFDEGGLTLADKILEISGRVTSGIILYGDKKVAQSEDTVNLYALVLDDNTAVSGETVRFYSDIPLTTTSITSYGVSLGDDYWVSTSSTANCGIGKGGSEGFIQFNSTTIKIYTSSWSPEYHYTGKFHIKDKVLTYTDMNGETQTIDLTGVATSQSYGTATGPFTVEYFWKDAVTNSEGIATIDYDCTGSGLREFYATSGTFVSGTLSVWDTLWFDNNSSEHESKWKFSQPNAIVTESDNARVLDNTVSTGSSFCFFRPQLNNTVITPSQPFAIEFKHITLSNASQIAFNLNGEFTRTFGQLNLGTTEKTVKIVVQDNTVKYYVDNSEVTGITDTVDSTSPDIRIRVNAGHTVTIKDFKVYSI